MNVEGRTRSILPDDLIAKILSYNGIKQVIETSLLSSRWKYFWTSVPYLNFSSEDFSNKAPKFYRFLTRVFSSCDDQVEFSLNLCGKLSQVFVNKILKDACSRNIQKLTLSVLYESQIELDLSLFSSRSLKHLSLIGPSEDRYDHYIKPTSMWELPSLTTLHLYHFTLYDDNTNKCVGLFSKCPNLENLTLDDCYIIGPASFSIYHLHISNLTIKNLKSYVNSVKVVTHQLRNLSLINCDGEHMIFAPDLTSLIYKNHSLWFSLDMDSLPSLKNVDICVGDFTDADDARKVVNLLQKFYNVRFLTLSTEIIEIICSFVQLIAIQPSPFLRLQSLKIYPVKLHDSLEGELTLPTEVRNYLLNSSPSATLQMVSRKELRAARDAKFAQSLMEELKLLLDQEKAQLKKRKSVIEPQQMTEMPLVISERVKRMEGHWVDLQEQLDEGKRKTSSIVTLILQIGNLLVNVPVSKKAEMQSYFSSLSAEADTVMDKIVNVMKIGRDNNESGLRVCLHELATASKSSS